MNKITDLAQLEPGTFIGTTDWLKITQDEVNLFGGLTRDEDPLHVDPDAAAVGPFGETIVFGFQTLSMLSHFAQELLGWSELGIGINYGFNKVRFTGLVPVGARIRAHFTYQNIQQRDDGGQLLTLQVVVEVEAKEKPALVAEWLALLLPENHS